MEIGGFTMSKSNRRLVLSYKQALEVKCCRVCKRLEKCVKDGIGGCDYVNECHNKNLACDGFTCFNESKFRKRDSIVSKRYYMKLEVTRGSWK